MKRASGVLMPISSIPSKYGIGCFSKEAYQFVDFLEEAGQAYWQILPMGPTGYGDSPYQSFSTFAGNPYFIDLEQLIECGWITRESCEQCEWGECAEFVDYGRIYQNRYRILKTAFENSKITENETFITFCAENVSWLENYALYMVIKDAQEGKPWKEWEEKYRMREENALDEFRNQHEKELCFQKFMQYLFWVQWQKIKAYANEKKIQIIGDIPIYVAEDGADCWAHRELFQFDQEGKPRGVAGCPPDAFSATGQLWGNPLYDWAYQKETGYAWWMERIRHLSKWYDVIRIDHFRGFEAYYSIPYGDETAQFGHWEQGPGMNLFRQIKKEMGDIFIIAEDLGFLTESVFRMVEETGYPGMKVLEFAFYEQEKSMYLPHNFKKNCVVYTGTHDNDTLMGWFPTLRAEEQEFCRSYLGLEAGADQQKVCRALIRLAESSVADTCIIPIQDHLGLGSEARMNFPSTFGGNWRWRAKKEMFTSEKAKEIFTLTKMYGRENSKEMTNLMI